MKWVNKENTNIDEEDKNFILRNCSSSYERFMFDLCEGNEERSYIRTACRVMKALVKQLRTRPNQAAVLLSSYHLKTIAMYCILLLTVPSKLTSHSSHLNGVREALGYFLTFLFCTTFPLSDKQIPVYTQISLIYIQKAIAYIIHIVAVSQFAY